MRKHGTNRPTFAAIAAISALLVASLGGSAFAGTAGSKTQSGTAVYLVDYDDQNCVNNTANTSDNVLDGDYGQTGIWVKSAELKDSAYSFVLSYTLVDKGNNVVHSGVLYEWNNVTCGEVFRLYLLQGGYGGSVGSLTVKVTYASDGKAFGNDSARFI